MVKVSNRFCGVVSANGGLRGRINSVVIEINYSQNYIRCFLNVKSKYLHSCIKLLILMFAAVIYIFSPRFS